MEKKLILTFKETCELLNSKAKIVVVVRNGYHYLIHFHLLPNGDTHFYYEALSYDEYDNCYLNKNAIRLLGCSIKRK